MNIVHIAGDAPSSDFGTMHTYYGIEKAMINSGHSCVHIASSKSLFLNSKTIDGIKISYARGLPVHEAILSTIFFQVSSLEPLKKSRPDVINTCGCDTLGAALFAKKHDIPLIHFLFGSSIGLKDVYCKEKQVWGKIIGYSTYDELRNAALWRVRSKLERRLSKLAEKVSVPCVQRREEVLKNFGLPEEKVKTVHLGVDCNDIQKKIMESSNRINSGYKLKDDFIFLTVGGSIWRKGILWYLKAIRDIKNELGRDIKFVIVGLDYPKRVKEIAKSMGIDEYLLCEGHMRHEQIIDYYAAADAFVLPSVEEGFGLVTLEALSAGLPTIATKVGGVADILTNQKDAVVVAPGNSKELSTALIEVLNSDALRNKLKRNGLEIAKKYTWEKTANEMLAIYQEVIEEKK